MKYEKVASLMHTRNFHQTGLNFGIVKIILFFDEIIFTKQLKYFLNSWDMMTAYWTLFW